MSHTAILVDGDNKKIIELLQGQLSSDINKIKNSSCQLSSICDEKGFVIADLIVCIFQNRFYLIVSNFFKNLVVSELEKFAKFYKVSLKKSSLHISFIISKLENEKNYLINNNEIGLNVLLSEEIISKENIPEEEFNILMLLLGTLSLESVESRKYRPAQIGYDKNRISFNKGCFRGQEIIARMEYLSKNKKCFKYLHINNFNKFHGISNPIRKIKLFDGSYLICGLSGD